MSILKLKDGSVHTILDEQQDLLNLIGDRLGDEVKNQVSELIENKPNIVNDTVEYVVGDGIIAEKLQESLNELNLSDEDKESLIDDIENIIKNSINDEVLEGE